MQKFNYHGHTKRCGHAIGEDEEYVVEAIKAGFKRIGFSDHAPYKNGYAQGERMHDYEYPQYIQSILALQKKYEQEIEIRIGIECEYFEAQLPEIAQYKNSLDYIIVGQHEPGLFQEGVYTKSDDETILTYARGLEKACDAKLPDIIAHPDLFMFCKEEWTPACEEATRIICESAQRNDVILEINLNGLQYGRCQIGKELRYKYPYRKFWEIAQEYDVKVIYGLDAHTPQKYHDRNAFLIVDEILKGITLTKLEDLKFEKKMK